MKEASPLAIVTESLEILLILEDALKLQELKYNKGKTRIEIISHLFLINKASQLIDQTIYTHS
jgi:hypothetical protein